MTHTTLATAALQSLAEADPALAALSLWCNHRDAPHGNIPAWSDGATIHYAPSFAALPLHDQIGLAAHHILHIAFRHAPRARALHQRLGDRFDADLYGAGCDAIINQMLVMAGHTLPRPFVELTSMLKSALGEDLPPSEALPKYDADRLYMTLRHGPQAGRIHGGQSPATRARAYADRQGFVPDIDSRDVTADPDALEDADWQHRLTRALEAGRLAGRGLGRLGALIAEGPRPRTPWQTLLRGLVAKAALHAPRRDTLRPARRWLAADAAARAEARPAPAFEPGLARTACRPRIALGIDSSSSVDDALLSAFLSQTEAIASRTGAELHVMVFDDMVRSHHIADPARKGPVTISRDGGTDYADLFAKAAMLDPAILIVLTDLEATLPPKPRTHPVLWAVPDRPLTQAPLYGTLLTLAP